MWQKEFYGEYCIRILILLKNAVKVLFCIFDLIRYKQNELSRQTLLLGFKPNIGFI